MTSEGRASSGALPDLAYIVRPGENEELRHSLRSIAQHADGLYRKVWVVGTVLPWLRNIEPLPLDPHPDKFGNQRQSITALVNHPDVADAVVIANDDQFLLRPIPDWTPTHLGPIDAAIARFLKGGMSPGNSWGQGVQETSNWTRAQLGQEPLCYEAHIPLLFDKAALADCLERYTGRLCYANLYPIAGAGGEGTRDGNCKVRDRTQERLDEKLALDMPWISGNEDNFELGALGRFIRTAFPTPSRYEEA